MGKIVFRCLIVLLPFLLQAQVLEKDLSHEKWVFKKKGTTSWLTAKVPGTVHTDLRENGVIPEPFFADNEKKLQWIENEDWEYQTTFTLTKEEIAQENVELQFDGLDTYAKVYLNDKLILEADNMFRTWKVAVSKELKAGTNTLHILFESAVKKGKSEASKLPYILPGDEKVFTRKAQYQYGWDWGPRLVTAGIWKPVTLRFWNTGKINAIRYAQKILQEDKALLAFTVTVDSRKTGTFYLTINERQTKVRLKKGSNTIGVEYPIENPKRWWTNGLGEAHLYPFSVSLADHKKKTLATKSLQIGLRTVELVQEKDDKGKSFYFKLNGVPVFMKGANYIPVNSFLPQAGKKSYDNIVKDAKEANMNMLRVWGGGVYADDAFYDACDQNGILVWQDFMFACAMYPGDASFLDNVKKETIDNVNRLQHHTSIALWCGNNENDEGWQNWGWQKQYQYTAADSTKIRNDYKKLFHEVIPQTLDSLSGKEKNIYWPSSPSIGWGKEQSLREGDSHYWGVWWGMEPFEIYKEKVGRFMSEYGFQSMPDRSTFKAIANPDDRNLESEAVKNHQKHPTGYQTIKTYMARDFVVPDAFEDYIYVSQLLQAEGMKTAIEAHRRAKPYCMGTLYWQFNDCWPVTSWSSVDFNGNWKALHYQVQKSFENIILSVNKEVDDYAVFIVSDLQTPQQGTLEMELLDFKGRVLFQEKQAVTFAGNSSAKQVVLNAKTLARYNTKEIVLSVRLQLQDGSMKNALYYFEKNKDLLLPKPTITIQKKDVGTLEITTDVLAKNIQLSAEGTHFSDNYFDLLPQEKRLIKMTGEGKLPDCKNLYEVQSKK
ncbi:beta-mannosidase [Flavobacterium sp. UBA4197]|uniref:beta-mannosidase n=1 Tax=Flavobacterium sp. UBA4197 TaxID=1946546 RepID=UPI00257C8967|nr:glycoside hydrolase family 2 protein [Flavobacterium sp. UBA4197]